MGVARQSRRSSVLAERARRINRMSTLLAVLVPCAQLRTKESVCLGKLEEGSSTIGMCSLDARD
jgi:hypothetical protein